MTTEPLCFIPGPYGKPIAVYAFPDQPGEYHHDANGCMDLAGIHDPRQRGRCAEILKTAMVSGAVPFQIFLDHGGQKVPRAALPAPARSAYLDIPRTPKIDEVRENWVELAMDQPDWSTRAAALLDVIEGSTKEARSWAVAEGFDMVHAFSTSILVTSALEHLTETEIECLEAAAFYAVTAHDEWSEAGVEWLRPFRKTWFRDWAKGRPSWQAFASAMREVNHDLPSWIVKGGAA